MVWAATVLESSFQIQPAYFRSDQIQSFGLAH